MIKTALNGMTEPGDPGLFHSAEWFEPFAHDVESIRRNVLPTVIPRAQKEEGVASNRSLKPYPLDPTEPDGILLTGPAARCGIAALISKENGRNALTACWPFITDGVQITATVDMLSLAEDRLQAIVHAAIDDELSISWFDIFFAVDRSFYTKGCRHDFVITGIAHWIQSAVEHEIRVDPASPVAYQMNAIVPHATESDGSVRIRLDGTAVTLPLEEEGWYNIRGPVTKTIRYPLEILGQPAWLVTVTVARTGDEFDKPFNLPILMTDHVLAGSPPASGSDIEAIIRVQGHIWMPDV